MCTQVTQISTINFAARGGWPAQETGDQLGAKREHFGAENQTLGAKEDGFGAGNQTLGAKKGGFGAENQALGAKEDGFGAQKAQDTGAHLGAKQDQVGAATPTGGQHCPRQRSQATGDQHGHKTQEGDHDGSGQTTDELVQRRRSL